MNRCSLLAGAVENVVPMPVVVAAAAVGGAVVEVAVVAVVVVVVVVAAAEVDVEGGVVLVSLL